MNDYLMLFPVVIIILSNLILMVIILSLFTIHFLIAKPLSNEHQTARELIYKAYEKIVEANQQGANVTKLINKLNYVIQLLNKKNPNYKLIQRITINIINNATHEKITAEERNKRNLIISIITIVSAITITLILYFKVISRAYWKFRTNQIKRYGIVLKVEEEPRSRGREEVYAIILAIILVSCVFGIAYWIRQHQVVEPFSALAILGPNRKIGNYPTRVIVGEPFLIYIYVHNYMGKPMYYFVLIKLGNRSTPVNPCPLKPVKIYERVLNHNETWIFPLTMRINKTGINYRLIVELWVYNLTTKSITYHNRWCQLWINVTSKKIGLKVSQAFNTIKLTIESANNIIFKQGHNISERKTIQTIATVMIYEKTNYMPRLSLLLQDYGDLYSYW